MEDEDNLWTLGSPTRTSRMGSPSASIVTSIIIWQRNANLIKFTRCPGNCTMKYEDIRFKSRRTKITETIDNKEQDNGEIRKEQDKTNPEDLPEYIQLFIHLFNKKKFEKLPERCEWDHEINLMDEVPKELNAKAYAMTLKEEEALNQWLDEQLKAGLIVESKLRYTASCFYIPKKDGSLWLV